MRFMAASFVIVAHTEMFKSIYGLPNFVEYSNLLNFGGLGVYFFFVLSGFLITYLLLEEKERYGKINLKAFYVRRILRIWPLYYLMVLLGFFVFPQISFLEVGYLNGQFLLQKWENFWLFMLMSPNIAFSFMEAVPHIGQLWSIGVEEQFYLLWPVFFRKLKSKLSLFIFLFILIISIKVMFISLIKLNILPESEFVLGLKRLIAMSKFESMMIGAIGANIVRGGSERLKKVMLNDWVFFSSLLFFPFVKILLPSSLDDVYHVIGSLCFIVIIVNVSIGGRFSKLLEMRLFSFLGNISYGLYMYHMVISFFFVKLFSVINADSIVESLLLYVLIFGVSILISFLSYRFFEKPFLKMKGKFTLVQSGKE